jgi:hypothetical protein
VLKKETNNEGSTTIRLIEFDPSSTKTDKNDKFLKTVSMNSQTHYKLITKSESYSKGGFGNGFMSKADRFTGINPLKYVHFPRSSAQTEFKRDVLSPKQAAVRVKKLTRRGEVSQPAAPAFLM